MMLNEYLTGLPIPVIKAKYWPRVESIEFYISTVGAVINAAGEAYVRPMKEGAIQSWNVKWPGHSKFSGVLALTHAGPSGF